MVRKRLQSEKNRLIQRLSQDSETEAIQELSPYDNHPADLASETLARELDLGLRLALEEQIGVVDRAFQKWEAGSYGVCDQCGQAIDPERLAAMPEAIYCLACQASVEAFSSLAARSDHRGNAEPNVIGAPEEENIFHALAEWGSSDSPQDFDLSRDDPDASDPLNAPNAPS